LAIKSTTSVLLFRCPLDQTLSFNEMAQWLLKKANARLEFLYRNKQYLNQHTKTLLVMSLIQCHYNYACCIWYNGLNKVLNTKLQAIQNKLISFVLDLESRAHISKEHFELLKWLPVNSRVDHLTLCHVSKMKNGLSAQYMREHFIPQDGVHIYNTRLSSKGAFVIPKVNSHGLKSFCYNGCSLWNSLPHTLSENSNMSHFKVTIKQHLFSSF